MSRKKAFNPDEFLRENIRNLKPYSSARSEFLGEADVFLDANENALGSTAAGGLNRYPDPLQWRLKEALGLMKGVAPSQIFLGNGSDEPIDLMLRAFCRPGLDEIIIMPPTYGMYAVSADINDVKVLKAPLSESFEIAPGAVFSAASESTKIIFICSPNNPTGNCFDPESIKKILQEFSGLVVLDEAYIDYAPEGSFLASLSEYPNLVVLQTFSKAWGMASLRLGVLYASSKIVNILNKVKPPYNLSGLTQKTALRALENEVQKNAWVQETISEREKLSRRLLELDFVLKVYPSEANFLLVKTANAAKIYHALVKKGIVVRDRSKLENCANCLRITVGAPMENRRLLQALESIEF